VLSTLPDSLIQYLNAMPTLWVWCLMVLTAYSGCVLMGRLFGAAGLYAFIVLAVIGANIQVLKAVQFPFHASPVAIGTELFTATYLATDILNELYGRKAARKGVWIGFCSYFLFVAYMVLALGYAPLTPAQAGEEMAWNLPYHDHLKALFLPAPAFFIAGMAAFLTSELLDVRIYSWIRGKTGDKWLWLRNNGSTMLSALVDNTVFSVLAWVVLAPEPVSTDALISTYILGTYLVRVVLALVDTPFMYLACRGQKRGEGTHETA
jgi:queuosine precursor transporter